MLQTPATFLPLILPQAHASTLTMVFQRDRLLLRDEGLALPAAEVVAALALPPARLHAVGLWQQSYYQTAWTELDAVAPAGRTWAAGEEVRMRLDVTRIAALTTDATPAEAKRAGATPSSSVE